MPSLDEFLIMYLFRKLKTANCSTCDCIDRGKVACDAIIFESAQHLSSKDFDVNAPAIIDGYDK